MTKTHNIEIVDYPSFSKIIRITTYVGIKIHGYSSYVLQKNDSLIVNQLLTTKSNKLALLNIKNNSYIISIVAKSILDPINYKINVRGQWDN